MFRIASTVCWTIIVGNVRLATIHKYSLEDSASRTTLLCQIVGSISSRVIARHVMKAITLPLDSALHTTKLWLVWWRVVAFARQLMYVRSAGVGSPNNSGIIVVSVCLPAHKMIAMSVLAAHAPTVTMDFHWSMAAASQPWIPLLTVLELMVQNVLIAMERNV